MKVAITNFKKSWSRLISDRVKRGTKVFSFVTEDKDDMTPAPFDYNRYAAAPKVRAKKREERSTKMIDPEDPTTWPRKLETKRERLMYLFDILGGSNLHGSYKQVWVDDFFDGADSKRVKLSRDILEDVADLNAIWKSGGFRHIPLPVAESLMLRFATTGAPVDMDDLLNPDPETRPMSPQDIIAISLKIARLYFLGSHPVFTKLMRRTIDIYGEELGLRHLASVCAKTATYEGMFDLSQYDDL